MVEKSEMVFIAIFVFEAISKMLAMGLILGKDCYLRDGWNWLDFIVVITSLMSVFPSM
jgi:hypothetical protein